MWRNLSSCWILHQLGCKTHCKELDQGDDTPGSWVMAAFVLAERGTLFGSIMEQHNCDTLLSQCVKVVG